jgi:drug/metabolite transporter (DMT)-like permease
MMFYQVAIAGLVLSPFLANCADLGANQGWLYLLVLGVFFTALPHTLFIGSLRHIKAKKASLISCLVPVYGTALAAIILSEIPSARTMAGGSIVVMVAVFVSLRNDD